jgi:putative addiction module killer protein
VIKVREAPEFNRWLRDLRDTQAKARIAARIRRLAFGNPGDVKPIGGGLSEMRIDYGPGYRVYFKTFGPKRIVVLGGGDKTTQSTDITAAQVLAKTLEGDSR